jgi:hypothetical protein
LISDVSNDIDKLTSIKKDYTEIVQKIKETSIQGCKYIEFNYDDIQLLNNIECDKKKLMDNNFKYIVKMQTVPFKSRKMLDDIYTQISIPIRTQQSNKTLILKYQHNQPVSDGEIIGTRY